MAARLNPAREALKRGRENFAVLSGPSCQRDGHAIRKFLLPILAHAEYPYRRDVPASSRALFHHQLGRPKSWHNRSSSSRFWYVIEIVPPPLWA